MNYEEKYKQALCRAKTFCKRWDSIGATNSELVLKEMKEIFPELNESTDELTKKSLINFLKSPFVHENITDEKVAPWIVWLEKQGKETSWKPSKDEMDVLYGLAYITNQYDEHKEEVITRLYQDLKREFFNSTSYENMFPNTEDSVRRRSTIQVLEYARSLDTYNQYGKADIDKNIAWLEKQSWESEVEPYITESIFPEHRESTENNIRELISELRRSLRAAECQNDACGGGHDKRIALLTWGIAWLEKQVEPKTDCPQNHQDMNHPNGCIVKEDFNGGEGFYKVNLDYLNKKQAEEIEEMIRVWNKEISNNDNIKHCVSMCLTDADEQRFKDYGTNLKDCLAWLEKQDANKEYVFRPLAGTMIENAIEQALKQGDVVLAFNGFYTSVKGKTSDEILTEYDNWLEKQGDKESQVILPAFTFDDVLALQCCMEIVKKVQEDKDLYEKLNDLHGRVYDAYHLEKQGENKPDDNVKPKFKVGDWIVFNGLVLYINEIVNGYYRTVSIGGVPCSYDWAIDNIARLWTINDAKDGDVLMTTKTRNCPFIYRKTDYNNNLAYYYAGVNGNGDFCEGCLKRTMCHFGSVADITPATKEQRDLLLQKMKEAGYEWDSKKKELKK